jgi:PAS domain S-box-containing protein
MARRAARRHGTGLARGWRMSVVLLDAAASIAASPPWRDRLALLLESTGDGIFGVDMAGRCMFANRAAAELLGYQPQALLGRNMHALIHHSREDGSPYPEADCPIFNAFRQGLPCRIDTEVFWDRERRPFPVEYSSHPILEGRTVRGAVIAFLDITERKRAADALHRATADLALRVEERTRELSAALAQQRELAAYSHSVREEERTRIAREVHDELGSLLVALKMDVNWVDRRLAEQGARDPAEAQAMRERMRCKCQNMSRLIENAVSNVGRIITDLRPSILDHQGLWAALEWQAQEFADSGELALAWQLQVPAGFEPGEPVAMAIFRIFQEMLSNVGRHARAHRIAVRIEVEGGALHLSVQDDGVGALAESFEAPTSYGVMGMRERARHFGGRVHVTSAPGQGTTFTLELPLATHGH